MKKVFVLYFALLLAFALMGCGGKVAGREGSDTTSSEAVSVESASETDSSLAESSEPASADDNVSVQQTEAASSSSKATESSKSATGGSSQSSTGKTSQPPKQDTPPVSSAPVVQPSEPVEGKSGFEKPYNTEAILAEAERYGLEIGVGWDNSLTKENCTWEAPINASSFTTESALKNAIYASINRVKKLAKQTGYADGECKFKLYLQPVGDGDYEMYFLMG